MSATPSSTKATKSTFFLTPVNVAFQESITITAHEALPTELQKEAMDWMFQYLTDKKAGNLCMVPIAGEPSQRVITCTILSKDEIVGEKSPTQYIRDQAYTIKKALKSRVNGEIDGPYLLVTQR